MRHSNVLLAASLLCTNIYVNCMPNILSLDKLSKNKNDHTLVNVSISAITNNENANSNAPLIDKYNFGNNNEGESDTTSSLDMAFRGYSVNSDDKFEECILQRSEFYLSWWVHENGSLKIPSFNRSISSGFLDLSIQFATETSLFEAVLSFTSQHPREIIRLMSIANNKLRNIPASVLRLTSSLQYLSLADNNFYNIFEDENTTFENFTAFPLMSNLLELDLRNCHMNSLKYNYFTNLPRLIKLFASHNYFTAIYPQDVQFLVNLQHLDVSYNQMPPDLADKYDGLYLDEGLFKPLPKLRFLDLSYSKLKEISSKAFRYLGSNMSQISLCYTNLISLDEEAFENTNLRVIDLSGNGELYKNLTPHYFQLLDDTLEIFVFRNANIRDKQLFTYLKNLRMLDLRYNEIDTLVPYDFGLLKNLEILDLGNNKISNWKSCVFSENTKIKVLNLRNNNLTVIKQQMLQDFYRTQYLAIGSNDFICACNLRDFIDRASRNTIYRQCRERSRRSIEMLSLTPADQYNVFLREYKMINSYYQNSNKNILAPILNKFHKDANFLSMKVDETATEPTSEIDCVDFDFDQRTHMNFNFLLLDYDENDYKCLESMQLEQRSRFYFNEISSCFDDFEPTLPDDSTEDVSSSTLLPDVDFPYDGDDFIIISNYNQFFIKIGIVLSLAIAACLCFWKRKEIKYFLSLFKNTLILSFGADDEKTSMLRNRKKSTNSVDHFQYDVFVSYSDNDRSWVLDQLIPNFEKQTEINICLHERDFQVGLGILENIIQCMDKSRCLLLVVSESFLKSNWCAFEMHLAQHRLIETRREQLILVLLHDIPKARRTRTLQYLMRTKTYIMWPNDENNDSRTTFWKRLKKAIILNENVSDANNQQNNKQRHSIV